MSVSQISLCLGNCYALRERESLISVSSVMGNKSDNRFLVVTCLGGHSFHFAVALLTVAVMSLLTCHDRSRNDFPENGNVNELLNRWKIRGQK